MVEGTDTLVRLPLLADLTYNEAHAALLGLVGILAGVGFRAGFREIAALFTACVVLVAFGLKRLSGERSKIGARVVRREPWYFLTVYVVTAVAAALAYPLL